MSHSTRRVFFGTIAATIDAAFALHDADAKKARNGEGRRDTVRSIYENAPEIREIAAHKLVNVVDVTATPVVQRVVVPVAVPAAPIANKINALMAARIHKRKFDAAVREALVAIFSSKRAAEKNVARRLKSAAEPPAAPPTNRAVGKVAVLLVKPARPTDVRPRAALTVSTNREAPYYCCGHASDGRRNVCLHRDRLNCPIPNSQFVAGCPTPPSDVCCVVPNSDQIYSCPGVPPGCSPDEEQVSGAHLS